MRKDIRIVVSAEDSPYMLWQCILFRHSCKTRIGVEPYFVVHRLPGRRNLSDSWERFIPKGNVINAPSYVGVICGETYLPRNSAGTLVEISNVFRDGWIVLCDPDMIFARDPRFTPGWRCSRVSFGPNPSWVESGSSKRAKVPGSVLRVGAPYILDAKWARRFGNHWLSRMDATTNYVWEISMWEYVFTARDLRVKYKTSNFCAMNEDGFDRKSEPMIHYCYGSSRWDKRWFLRDELAVRVFDIIPTNPSSKVESEIFRQLREVALKLKRGEPAL